MAIRCARERHALDCDWVLEILREWIKAEPSLANQLTEAILQCAPECRDALQSPEEGPLANPPNNINAPPGSFGGGGGQSPCQVCHNGQLITIPCDQVDEFLRTHPGDTRPPCQITTVTNQ